MDLETHAVRHFEAASRDTYDSVAKKMFREIAEEEKFHYDLLQAQHDSLTNSGFWFDSAEFRMDGKY